MATNIDFIAYCGLCCGEYLTCKGKVADLARDLGNVLNDYRFDKAAELLASFSFFKIFEKYDDGNEVLGGMVKFRCKSGCRNGGGNAKNSRRCFLQLPFSLLSNVYLQSSGLVLCYSHQNIFL